MEVKNSISRLKQGDLNGLEVLVNRYQVRAVRAAYLILYDHQLAEDIAQTAFIKAAERIHQFDDERPFAPWLFRIVVNDALKLAKKLERDVSMDEQLDVPAAQITKWLTNPDPGPEIMVEEMQLRESILTAIRSLPPEQRSVIVMRYYLDLSLADMSKKWDRPLSTIKWWLRDARRRLRGLMETPQERWE